MEAQSSPGEWCSRRGDVITGVNTRDCARPFCATLIGPRRDLWRRGPGERPPPTRPGSRRHACGAGGHECVFHRMAARMAARAIVRPWRLERTFGAPGGGQETELAALQARGRVRCALDAARVRCARAQRRTWGQCALVPEAGIVPCLPRASRATRFPFQLFAVAIAVARSSRVRVCVRCSGGRWAYEGSPSAVLDGGGGGRAPGRVAVGTDACGPATAGSWLNTGCLGVFLCVWVL